MEEYHIGQIVFVKRVPYMNQLKEKFAAIDRTNTLRDGAIGWEYPRKVRILGEEKSGAVYVGLSDIRPITKEEKTIVAIIKMGAQNEKRMGNRA